MKTKYDLSTGFKDICRSSNQRNLKKAWYIMATKFKFYSQEKSMKNIKSSVFSGFMYIACSHQKA